MIVCYCHVCVVFFFKQKTAYEMRISDWSSDVCSSDRRDLGAKLFDQWLRAAQLGEYCDLSRTLEIWLPSDFSANFVAANFQDRLRLAWRSANMGVDEVCVRRAPGAGALKTDAHHSTGMALMVARKHHTHVTEFQIHPCLSYFIGDESHSHALYSQKGK